MSLLRGQLRRLNIRKTRRMLSSVATQNDPLERIFEENRKWSKEMIDKDENYFKCMEKKQEPKYLFIGCSDSRVPPNTITGLAPGELFVHRNVANLVVNTDMNFLSVLQFAVDSLKVEHVIVCGHYGCGGVEESTKCTDHGLLENWIRNVRDVQRLHHQELSGIKDVVKRRRRLVELNVQEQCYNLLKTNTIQQSLRTRGFPHIHGLVYNLHDGILKRLPLDFTGYPTSVYALHPEDGEQS